MIPRHRPCFGRTNGVRSKLGRHEWRFFGHAFLKRFEIQRGALRRQLLSESSVRFDPPEPTRGPVSRGAPFATVLSVLNGLRRHFRVVAAFRAVTLRSERALTCCNKASMDDPGRYCDSRLSESADSEGDGNSAAHRS